MRTHDKYGKPQQISLSLGLLQLILVIQFVLAGHVAGIDAARAASLKAETEELFYHGYENYMRHAFPEDELRPVSCTPLTRDATDPARIEVNDALGNYSLTLIDSLSTLAILASSPADSNDNKPLRLFQDGIKNLVEQYGDGSDGPRGDGKRARAFALDSKVQVFETVIRGLGGLLSAHLFAVGDLPITGYSPPATQVALAQKWSRKTIPESRGGIVWDNDFVYDGQLLRLAYDLGKRLIPAFWTPTGIPYPRVNLKHGIPFYANSPNNQNPIEGQCDSEGRGTAEVTETCSAGAGSLVLEFTVLSRLTGDPRFEELAKRAFWAIWNRRSDINLIGAGIDAETGLWVQPYTGIGAGIDSFFEYAFKSFVLLSSDYHPLYEKSEYKEDPRTLFGPLPDFEHLPSTFEEAWEIAHAANKRHLLRFSNFQHPHYIQGDINTGAARAFWIDALSAFYPGLLTISGYVEEAIETHLLATALWTRFSALPERWNLITGGIEGGLGWWVGRPEFIESNYYLYRATEDPWYQHVAEMTLKDIQRRCWSECGWSGIQNVLTGEKSDRMESFFLGETAKYLFLTFDDRHPLNTLDSPIVFSTEGHPLIIPPSAGSHPAPWAKVGSTLGSGTCPARLAHLPFTISATAARGDVYHAGSLARLHMMPNKDNLDSTAGEYVVDHPSIMMTESISPSNHTYFPWTLPLELIPHNAVSTILPTRPTFDISFPTISGGGSTSPPLQRVKDGILINSLGGLRLGMVQDVPFWVDDDFFDGYRIHSINSVGLGKDEKVFLARDTGMNALDPADPDFTRVRDMRLLDIVVEVIPSKHSEKIINETVSTIVSVVDMPDRHTDRSVRAAWQSIMSQITSLMQDTAPLSFPFTIQDPPAQHDQTIERRSIPAIMPTGIGAAPLPDWIEAPSAAAVDGMETPLVWRTVYTAGDLCNQQLPQNIPRNHQIIVIKRGNCSFSKKLSNIPVFTPSSSSLQLVVVVNYNGENEGRADDLSFRPLLDEAQMTSSGLQRRHPLPMVMIGGGAETYNALHTTRGVGIKRRYTMRSQGVPITNLIVV